MNIEPYDLTASELAQIIGILHKKRVDVSWSGAKKYDRRITYVALKLYRSWDELLRAAGLNPARIRRRPKPKCPYKTEQDVIAGIYGRWLKEWPLNYHSAESGPHKDLPLVNKARRLFGGWKEAVEATGFDYTAINKKIPRYETKDQVIAAIQNRIKNGLSIKVTDVRRGEAADGPLHKCALDCFGSWREAKRAAGVAAEELILHHGGKYRTKKLIVAEIKRRQRAGIPINSEAVSRGNHMNKALFSSAHRLFGGWGKALESMGIDYKQLLKNNQRTYPTPKAVLKEIKRRYKEGLPITVGGVSGGKHRDHPLYYIAKCDFGFYQAAVEAAGIDYASLPGARPRRAE